MPNPSTHSLPSPKALSAVEARPTSPREWGRQMILWGWIATMAGVGCYCRAILTLAPEADFLDTFTHAGPLGWASALLMGGGVALWLSGNLRYLKEAMDAPAPGGTP